MRDDWKQLVLIAYVITTSVLLLTGASGHLIGPESTTAGHLVSFSNTTGTMQDSGTALSNLVITNPAIAQAIVQAVNTNFSVSGSGTGVADFSGMPQFKLPVVPGYAASASGEIGHDSTNHNWHVWQNAADNFMALFPTATPPTSGDVAGFLETGNTWTLEDLGAPIGLANANNWTAEQTFSKSPTGSAPGTLFSGTPTTSSLYYPVVYINGGGTNPTWFAESPMLAINTPSSYNTGASAFQVAANGTSVFTVTSGGSVVAGGSIQTGGSKQFQFGNNANFSGALGVISVGTGQTQGTGGSLVATAYESGGTKFTASGCSNSTTVGGATAGQFASGTTGTCTVVITMNGATGFTASNGWACRANDLTTPSNLISQTGSTTTTCTIQGTTVSGDTINFSAIAY
jgi:hypothetical protein